MIRKEGEKERHEFQRITSIGLTGKPGRDDRMRTLCSRPADVNDGNSGSRMRKIHPDPEILLRNSSGGIYYPVTF